jgi:hypothetical protein
VTWLLRLISGVLVLAGQASFVPHQVADEEYGPDSRGEFIVEPKSGPPGTTITFRVRCTTRPNLTGSPADSVVLRFGKNYDTTYDRGVKGDLDRTGSGVFVIVVPDEVPPTRPVNGGETDIAYGVGGSCFSDDMGLSGFRRNFVVTAASVSPTVAPTVKTSGQSAAPVTGLPKTGSRLVISLTATIMLLVGVGLALRGARRRQMWGRER